MGKFFSLHQERFYISVQTQLSQVDLFDVCVLLEVVYKTKIIQCLHLMSISNKYAYVLKMGYKPSDPVDFDFFMAVPCGCLNPQSIYSVGCVLHMVNNLHSIGITMIQQRLYQELGMLFVFFGTAHVRYYLLDFERCHPHYSRRTPTGHSIFPANPFAAIHPVWTRNEWILFVQTPLLREFSITKKSPKKHANALSDALLMCAVFSSWGFD